MSNPVAVPIRPPAANPKTMTSRTLATMLIDPETTFMSRRGPRIDQNRGRAPAMDPRTRGGGPSPRRRIPAVASGDASADAAMRPANAGTIASRSQPSHGGGGAPYGEDAV